MIRHPPRSTRTSHLFPYTTLFRSDDDGYYAHVNASSPGQLRCSLHETIRGHTLYPYSGSGTSTWTVLEIADEDPANAGRILDAYRNRSYAKGSDREIGRAHV